MKRKAKIYKGKRIVMGDKNLVTKNEIHITDVCKDLGGHGEGEDNLSIFPLYLTHDSKQTDGFIGSYIYNPSDTTKELYETLVSMIEKHGVPATDGYILNNPADYGVELYLDEQFVEWYLLYEDGSVDAGSIFYESGITIGPGGRIDAASFNIK